MLYFSSGFHDLDANELPGDDGDELLKWVRVG
jgi:hypothetical protein